jgi:hypothetical protein
MTEFELIADGLRFPEGPVVMPDGSVILTEIARGTITRCRPGGRKEIIAEVGGGPTGLRLAPMVSCIAATMAALNIMSRTAISPRTELPKIIRVAALNGSTLRRVRLKRSTNQVISDAACAGQTTLCLTPTVASGSLTMAKSIMMRVVMISSVSSMPRLMAAFLKK